MRRCCYCRRTFGPAPGLAPHEHSDGCCEACWPALLAEAGLSPRPFVGEMTLDRRDAA